jgi:hypothetical protein
MSSTLWVPFSGDGAGTEELTWGQRDIWQMMEMSGTTRMVGGTTPLATGTTVTHIAHLLSFIVSRHQSLRTRISLMPDGTPIQVLASSGEVALEIVDAGDGADPASVAETVRSRYGSMPIDLAIEWPVRMAVIQQDGKPAYFAVMYPHVVIDGYGVDALSSDLTLLDQATGEHLGPRSGIQPLDLARQQQSPTARRQSAASLRYWDKLLSTHSASQFGDSATPREPRYWEATYDSPAAFLAASAISAQTGLHTGAIVMAAYAFALAHVTGVPRRLIRVQVSNRFRPGFAHSVSTLVQPGLCVIDVTSCTLAEAAQQAWRSQLAAGKHGYYDPRDLPALTDPCSYFNDRRRALAAPTATAATAPSREAILAALPASTLTPGVRYDNRDVTAYLNVNAAADTLNYTLRVDTQALSPSDQESILRSIESILVSAALAS